MFTNIPSPRLASASPPRSLSRILHTRTAGMFGKHQSLRFLTMTGISRTQARFLWHSATWFKTGLFVTLHLEPEGWTRVVKKFALASERSVGVDLYRY